MSVVQIQGLIRWTVIVRWLVNIRAHHSLHDTQFQASARRVCHGQGTRDHSESEMGGLGRGGETADISLAVALYCRNTNSLLPKPASRHVAQPKAVYQSRVEKTQTKKCKQQDRWLSPSLHCRHTLDKQTDPPGGTLQQQKLCDVSPASEMFVLIHTGILPDNVMVDWDNIITGVLDWQEGWYPNYWEYMQIFRPDSQG